jgi:hypothetical protein
MLLFCFHFISLSPYIQVILVWLFLCFSLFFLYFFFLYLTWFVIVGIFFNIFLFFSTYSSNHSQFPCYKYIELPQTTVSYINLSFFPLSHSLPSQHSKPTTPMSSLYDTLTTFKLPYHHPRNQFAPFDITKETHKCSNCSLHI